MGIGNINALKPGNQDFWDQHDPSGGLPVIKSSARTVALDVAFSYDSELDILRTATEDSVVPGSFDAGPDGTNYVVVLDVPDGATKYYAGLDVTLSELFLVNGNDESSFTLESTPIGGIISLPTNTRDSVAAAGNVTVLASMGIEVEYLGFGGVVTSLESENTFVVVEDPTIISITPSSGTKEGGTSVEIVGTNFVGVEEVRQSSFHLFEDYVVVDDEHITATTAYEGAAFVSDITITTHAGTAVLTGGFEFVSP